jgi:stress response protein YsnF
MVKTMVSLNAHTLQQKARINTLLDRLKEKVNNFAVVNKQGKILGEVRDLIVDDNRQLSFIISSKDEVNRKRKSYFQLKSNLVNKIDSQTQSIETNMENSQMEELPEYHAYLEVNKSIPMEDNTINQQVNKSIPMEDNAVTQEVNTIDITPTKQGATEVKNEISSGVTENAEVVEEEIIRLLGEKLVVDRTKHKVGEVIVRKEIETRMIQVPVRREKLIVEQVNPERKQLAEINLGQGEISELELQLEQIGTPVSIDNGLSVSGEFDSPKIASLLLNAIALEKNHGCKKVQVTIVVEDEERQQTYQQWFSRTSIKNTHPKISS